MDRVAACCAEGHNVRTLDLQALLRAIWARGLLSKGELRVLVEQMEQADRTTFPYKDALFDSIE